MRHAGDRVGEWSFCRDLEQEKTGLLCCTLADYCLGVQLAPDGYFDRQYVREQALRYDMFEVAKQYGMRRLATFHVRPALVSGRL